MRQIPLAFEPFGSGATGFLTRGPGYTVHLDSQSAVLTLREATTPQPSRVMRRDLAPTGRRAAVRMRLVGALEGSSRGEDPLPGVSNYLVGSPEDWRIAVPTYRRATFEGVYPNTDVIYYGAANGHLEFDFRLRPGSTHADIRLDFDGAEEIAIEDKGLLIQTAAGDLRLKPPVAYQESATGRVPVHAAFRRLKGGLIGFDLGQFDHNRTLVIDPVLDFSTVFGGNFGQDLPIDLAVDAAGSAYVVGDTSSSDYPTTFGSLDRSYGGGIADGFITKFDPSGSAVLYSTFFGGSGYDRISGIALDTDGNAYLTGFTTSPDFPVVGGLQSVRGGGFDSFVAKLDSAGTALGYSSFLGGSGDEEGTGIAVDATRAAIVTGYVESADYAVTAGALQTLRRGPVDAFVTKIAPDGGSLQFSTFLGGGSVDYGSGVAADSAGRIFVTGKTLSSNFPTHLALQPTWRGSQSDAFVTVLTPDGSGLHYSTYLGASGAADDQAEEIAVAADGSAVVTGITHCSNTGFPIVSAFQPICGGGWEAFVTKLAPDGQRIVFSSFLGGGQLEWGFGVGFGVGDSVWLTGWTKSPDLPTREPLFTGRLTGVDDAYVAHVSSDGATLLFSTFVEGTTDGEAVALSGDAAYVAGLAGSQGFLVKIVDVSARPDAYSTGEDVLLTVPAPGVLANDEGVTSVSLVIAPAHAASFALAADGSFAYLPSADFVGTDTFSYRASNGSVETAPATVTLAIVPANDPPDAVPDAFSGFEDTPLVVAAPGVLANDTDPDEDVLSAVLLEAPLSGDVTLAPDGSFVYTPDLDFSGTDSFTYVADDGLSQSAPATVTITIVAVNDPPAANPDSYSTDEDTPLVVTAAAGTLANDTDAEGDSLQAELVSGPANGTLSFSASGAFTYTPFANFFGTDSFRYSARDASSGSVPATVTVTVVGVNDATVPQSDSFAATEDSSLSVEAPGVLGNDTDPEGDALAAMLESQPSSGTLSLAADGSFVYTPDANFFGTDTFTYTVGDGTTLSGPITVTLSVAGVPEPPLTQPDSYTVEEDGLLTVLADAGVLANDSDPDGSGLSATLIDLPADGSLSFAASGAFTYQPPPDFHGSSSFTYIAWNDSFSSSLVTVSLTVTSTDDIPLAASDFVTTDQDISVTVRVLDNDVGLGDAPISLALSAPPINGNASVNADRTIRYTPAFYFAGQDQFSYTVTDADGQSSGATAYVTVEPAHATGPGKYGAYALATAYGPTPECDAWDESVRTPGYGWVIGSTSEYALASCAPRGIGPFSEAAVTLAAKTWRVEANAAGSGGDSQQGAGALSEAYAVDTYTVLKGTSELPDNAEVPLFIRLHLATDVQNTGPGTYPGYPSAYVHVDPFLQRYVPAGLTTFHGGEFRFTITEEKYMDIPLRSVTFGTRFRAFWILTAFAESGIGMDPKVAEASVEFSLCSSAPGVQVIGASGTDGDCGGDIRVSYAEAVQSVFGASTLVAGKDTAVAVHLGNDFDRPIETRVSFRVERSGLSPVEMTEIVRIPANCPAKRYYFPNPDPLFAGVCDLPSDALGVLPAEVEPIPGTDWRVSVTALTVDNLIETNPANNAPPLPPITYPVKETALAPVHMRVHCMAGDCVTDPKGYGTLPNTEYDDAIFWSNLHAQAMLPLGPLYDPTRCTDSGSDCVVPGDSQKCTGLATALCPGISEDIAFAENLKFVHYPSADMPVLVFPPGYYRYHQYYDIGGETVRRPFSGDVILMKAEGPSGNNALGANLPVLAHEFAHWAVYSLVDSTSQGAIPVHGYWVGCKQATLDPSLSCETPADAENLMGVVGRSPPGNWIELDTYEAVLAELKTTPDPRILYISGTLARDGVPTVKKMFTAESGKIDKSDGDLVTIEIIDDAGNVLASLSGGSLAEFDDSSSAPGIQRADTLGMGVRVPYPSGTALVRFRRGSEIVLSLDPLAGTLRTAIESIPSRGYDKNPEQRKKALLNKVDAFEKILSADKQGAQEKLRHDIRKSVEDWVTEYSGTALEFSKAKILALIDSIDARLEARLQATETPTPTPQP